MREIECIEGVGWKLITDDDVFKCRACNEMIEGDEFYLMADTGYCFHKKCGLFFRYPTNYEMYNVVMVERKKSGHIPVR